MASIGWLGTGTGGVSLALSSVGYSLTDAMRTAQSMGGADYIIAWPDVSGSSANWTLSHRVPGHSSHDMPQLASSAAGTDTQSYYQLVPSLSTMDASSPYGAVAFLRVLDPASGYPSKSGVQTSLASDQTQMIYASGSENPGSSSEAASFAQHDQVCLPAKSSTNAADQLVLVAERFDLFEHDHAGRPLRPRRWRGWSERLRRGQFWRWRQSQHLDRAWCVQRFMNPTSGSRTKN